eukprot:m.13867 g.13867  ORF g.13867 m.13867 type:complete len:143 (-) comp2877_c0_seq1:112-540(-)
MGSLWTCAALLVCVVTLAHAAKPITKLQIGVKKRVDDCSTKSKQGDVLALHYTGRLYDSNEEFDSSLPRGEPFTFILGHGQVIQGWDRGLVGMCIGEIRKLVVPADLAYGDRGAPPKIPSGATLVFEVELLNIERREDHLDL